MNKSCFFVGIFKFKDSALPKDLISEAQKMLAEDQNFTRLFIRRTSKEENGICFEYDPKDYLAQYENDKEKAVDAFLEKHRDYFTTYYGSAFKGWDVTNHITVIK